MSSAIRLAASCFLLLLISLPSSADATLPPESDKWMRIETTHFTLFSNAGKKRAIKVGKKLEELVEVLSETSRGMTINSPLPTTIFVFKDEASFTPYNLGEDGKPDNVSGYFISGFDGNYVAIDASAETLPYAVIYHEFLHYFLENNIPAIPLWLNEGIAEFYSTFMVRAGRAEIGRPILEHLMWMSSHPLMSLDTLFSIDTSSTDYNEGARQGTYYAESWALVHYLLIDPERRKGVDKLLALVGQGVSSTEAVERAFGVDLLTLEKDFIRYLQTMSERFIRYTPKEAFDDQSAKAFPMDRKEVLYRLGDLLVHHWPIQTEAAEAHLRAAISLDSSFTEPRVALGMLRLVDDRPAEAVEVFEKFLESTPEHKRARSLYGQSLLESYFATIDENTEMPEVTPPPILLAREQFRSVLDSEPDNIPGLIGLGQTFLVETGDLQEGIAALGVALRERPARLDVLQNLIVLTARSGNTAAAWSLLDRSLRSRGDAEAVQAVEAQIAMMEFKRVEALIEEGKHDEAIAVARKAADGVADPSLKRLILESVATLEANKTSQELNDLRSAAIAAGEAGDAELARELMQQLADQVGEQDVGSSEIDLYNEAVALSNAGDLEGARDRFARVASMTSNEALRVQAASYAEELTSILRREHNIDLYNEAVTAINGGDPATAVARLEKLLGRSPDTELEDEAKRLLRAARRAMED